MSSKIRKSFPKVCAETALPKGIASGCPARLALLSSFQLFWLPQGTKNASWMKKTEALLRRN